MNNQTERSMNKRSLWMIIAAAVWITLVSASFIWNRFQVKNAVMQLAKSELRSSFDKDVVYRHWAAVHGGVYVPVTDMTQPNPYLAHLPHRDVTTASGLHLTLINPAYMTRQVHELGRVTYGMQGHITSLKPLRPGNAPDAWETAALKAFDSGVKEVMSMEPLNGEPHIRFMRPLIVTSACMKCHKTQGYKEGDIRGGISVSKPLAFYALMESEQLLPLLLMHLLIGCMGLIGLWTGDRIINKSEKELKESEMRFRQIYDHMESGVAQVSMEFKIEHANHAYCRMLGYRENELIGKTLAEITHPEVLEENIQKQKQLASGEIRHYRMEKRFIHKEGHTVHGILDANLICDNGGSPLYFLGSVVNITERKHAEEELWKSECQKKLILNSTSEIVVYYDLDLRIIWGNRAMAQSVEKQPEDLIGRHCYEIWHQSNEPCHDCPVLKAFETGKPCQGEKQTPDKRCWILRGYPVFDEKGNITALVEFGQDITERKKMIEEKAHLEKQFHKAQKMESIGTLAGGVAHDLNNLLSPILGYGEMLLYDETGIPPAEAAKEIVSASLRARDLVRQLLAFSRKQTLEFKPVDLNILLADFEKLLRSTVREDIQINITCSRPLPLFKGDAGQLEQVIMNLAVNAQDAMPDGGILTIETALAELDAAYAAQHENVDPGKYIMLTVFDTGCGMDPETSGRLFEPFFTTKEFYKGGGLGLAAVYGIIKQHSGHIWVYSEEGMGTAFKIYLPVSEDLSCGKKDNPSKLSESVIRRSETILLVEDNEQVRNLAFAVLKKKGYTLLSASEGREALTIIKHHNGPVHLLLTDVVMPEMNGRHLFEKAVRSYPDLKVIYMSGYTDEIISRQGVIETDTHFIEKPFSAKALAAKVREVLDG